MKIEMIPLNRLVPSPANMRKTGRDAGVDELAASIAAHGLLQNLQVRPGNNGKFEVVAGGRRLAALKRLAKAKAIARDAEIPCHVHAETDSVEISLAENTMRLPTHPADQFEAFRALTNEGHGPEEIAARFGCEPMVIKRRLKLADVSPALIEAYRNTEMDLDQLMAFTVSDDHATQQKIWAELPAWNRHPSTIRRLLTEAHVEVSDRRARFVGVDAYVAAGGHVLRDLFDEEHEGYLTDLALLEHLATEKLELEAESLRGEGWKWVEIVPGIDYQRLHAMARLYPERREPSAEQQAEIERLTEAYEVLAAEHGEEPPEAVLAELEELSEQIDALSAGSLVWDPQAIAQTGCIIAIGHAGRLAIERGLQRPDDNEAVALASISEDAGRGKRAKRPQDEALQLPDRLIEDLTAQRTAALRFSLSGNAELALTAVVHVLALPLFYQYGADSCLTIRLDSCDLHGSAEGIEGAAAVKALADRYEAWRQRLPMAAEDLWDWLRREEMSGRLDLLAYCAACSIDAVRRSHEGGGSGRLDHANQLAVAVSLDMAQWWVPTAANYLGRVTKARILEAVREGVSPEAAENLTNLKKDALAAQAEERLPGTGWLPPILR